MNPLSEDGVLVRRGQVVDDVVRRVFHHGGEAVCKHDGRQHEVHRINRVFVQDQAARAEGQGDGLLAVGDKDGIATNLIMAYQILVFIARQLNAADSGRAFQLEAQQTVWAVELEVVAHFGGRTHRIGLGVETIRLVSLAAAHRKHKLALSGHINTLLGIEGGDTVRLGYAAAESGIGGFSASGEAECRRLRLVLGVHNNVVVSIPHQVEGIADMRLGVARRLGQRGLDGRGGLFIFLAACEGKHCEGAEAHDSQCLFHCFSRFKD